MLKDSTIEEITNAKFSHLKLDTYQVYQKFFSIMHYANRSSILTTGGHSIYDNEGTIFKVPYCRQHTFAIITDDQMT